MYNGFVLFSWVFKVKNGLPKEQRDQELPVSIKLR